MEGIESVEKLFLNIFFAGNKLDIVDQNAIGVAVFVFELVNVFGPEGRDKLVAKGFGGKVADVVLRMEAEKLVADGLHEVGFANANSAPDKERIVGESRVFDDALGGGESKIVAVANN